MSSRVGLVGRGGGGGGLSVGRLAPVRGAGVFGLGRRHLRVGLAQHGVLGKGGLFGGERVQVGIDRGDLAVELCLFLRDTGEFGLGGLDPQASGLLPGTRAEILGGRLGPGPGQRPEPETPVAGDPVAVGRQGIAFREQSDPGEQPAHQSVGDGGGEPVLGVDGRVQHIGQRRPVDRRRDGDQGVPGVGRGHGAFRADPAVEQPGGFQGRFNAGSRDGRQTVGREVDQPPQRSTEAILPGSDGSGVRRAGAALHAGPQLGELGPQFVTVVAQLTPAVVQHRAAGGQFGADVGGGLPRRHAGRVGARQGLDPVGEFARDVIGVGRAQHGAVREVRPDSGRIVRSGPGGVLLGARPAFRAVRQFGVRLLHALAGSVQRLHGPSHGGGEFLDQRDGTQPPIGELGCRQPSLLRAAAGDEGTRDPLGVVTFQQRVRRLLAGPGQRALQGAPGGFGTRTGRAEPAGASGEVLRGAIVVGHRARRGIGGATGEVRGLLQLPRAAHLRPGAQRLIPGPQGGPVLLQLRQPPPRRGQRADRGLEVLLGGVEFGAQGLVAGVPLARGACPAPGRGLRIPAVVAQERAGGVLGGDHHRELVLLLVQRTERLRHVGDHRLVHRRQSVGQRPRQRLLTGPFGQLGLPQLHQQVDQGGVPLFAEAEQGLVHRTAVRAGGVVHHAAAVERVGQPVAADRGAGGVQQAQAAVIGVGADAAVGDEEPVPGDPPAGHRLQSAPERRVPRVPRLVDPAELDPGVAEAFGVRMFTAEQQVPLHALLGVGVRLDPVRRQVPVQQERQSEREHLGLAGPVVAAQQQPAVAERELLDVVVEQVDQPDPERLPAGAGRGRQAGPDGSVQRAVPFACFVFGARALGSRCPGSSSTVSPTR